MVWQREKLLQVNRVRLSRYRRGRAHAARALFHIASMTKPVTVAAAMSLVDEGKLALREADHALGTGLCKVADAGRPPALRITLARRAFDRGPAHFRSGHNTVSWYRGQFAGLSAWPRSAGSQRLAAFAGNPFRSCQPGDR
ncbi:serine hydrolase [Mycobacterium tuberculosis]